MSEDWQNWQKLCVFDFDCYDVSNKTNCLKLYEDINQIGFYADQVCGNADVSFIRNQFKNIVDNDQFAVYNGTSIGNLAISLIILDETDLELKQRILVILKNHQKWLINRYRDHPHSSMDGNCSLI